LYVVSALAATKVDLKGMHDFVNILGFCIILLH